MQSDITPRPRTDFSSGQTVHRGDYGLTPASIAANQPAPSAIQIPIVDNSTPAVVAPVSPVTQITIVDQTAPAAAVTTLAPSAPPMPSFAIPVTSVEAPVAVVPAVTVEPVQIAAPGVQEAPLSTPLAASLPVTEPAIASAVVNLEVDPIVTPEPVLTPQLDLVSIQTSADANPELDADFAGLDMGQGSAPLVTPMATPALSATPPTSDSAVGHDSLLQSVESAPAATPGLEDKQPSAMKRWLQEHKKPVRMSVAAVAVLLVGFSGLGLYQGYTKDTPYVSIAAPKPVVPAAAKTTAKLASASFADNSENDKRQKTVKSVHEAVEAYYVKNGYYPTVNQMQTLSWIATNFKNFDMTQLKDPVGTTAGLVATPGRGVYAYQAGNDASLRGCDNDFANCNYYIVTATLSDGSVYTSTALQ